MVKRLGILGLIEKTIGLKISRVVAGNPHTPKTPVAVVATADSKKTGGDTTVAVATVSTTDTKESGVTATEDEVKKEKVWTESLTSTDLDGVSYSPTEIFSARRNILTYWKRAFTSKTPEARIENQQKTLTFKNLLEMTGLRVTLLDDGTGAISF